ncbi:hypothetical protein ACFVT6_12105 [Streptomyces sp. NPDC058049]|uniref:hypothetical protein n=1 Tax=Streptomyces sp. NPDC058049 TaxID=3346314 RepID=UPI0036E4D5B7
MGLAVESGDMHVVDIIPDSLRDLCDVLGAFKLDDGLRKPHQLSRHLGLDAAGPAIGFLSPLPRRVGDTQLSAGLL